MINIPIFLFVPLMAGIALAWFLAGRTVGASMERRKQRDKDQAEVDKSLRIAFNMLEWMEPHYLQGNNINFIFQSYLRSLNDI